MKTLLTAVRLVSLGLVLASVAALFRTEGGGRSRPPTIAVADLDAIRGLDTSKKKTPGPSCDDKNTDAVNKNGGFPGVPYPPAYSSGSACGSKNVKVGARCIYCSDGTEGPPQVEDTIVDAPYHQPDKKGVGQGTPVGCGALYVGRCGIGTSPTACQSETGSSSGQCSVNITVYSTQQQ